MKHYSLYFKIKAMSMYYLSGERLSMTATEVGVSPSTLYRWVNEKNIFIGKNCPSDVDLDTATFIYEIKALREENEILYKALMHLAKQDKLD